MDSKGKEQKGRINADSEAAAVAELKQKGMFPTSVKAVVAAKKGRTTSITTSVIASTVIVVVIAATGIVSCRTASAAIG